jgi:hypothetical protein
MDLIFEVYPKANVIIINGNGTEFYRLDANKISHLITNSSIIRAESEKNDSESKKLLEPSYMIEKMIAKYKNYPTFITGLVCVGMSITLINQNLGNFDNVVFVHHHFNDDTLYQLCRFLFNYTNWTESNKEKIKQTIIHSFTNSVYETIKKYEIDVERMSTDFAGSTVSLQEIINGTEIQPSQSEIRNNELNSIEILNNKLFQRFPVVDGNDNEQWQKVREFYKENLGKELKGKSMPKLIDGFYHCSTTKHPDKQSKLEISKIEKQSWWSTFQLLARKLKYARVFVGYEDLTNPTEYYIYVKYVIIVDNEKSNSIVNKYGKQKIKKTEEKLDSDSDSNSDSNQ